LHAPDFAPHRKIDVPNTGWMMRSVMWGAALATVAAAGAARAQEVATLAGTVRAQDGEPVAEVEVAFDGGAPVRSDARGRFALRIPAAAAGEVAFRAPGFAAERLVVAPVAAGGRRTVAVTLQRLFALDALTVVTEQPRPLLNTRDATTGGAVERVELEALPTDARNPLTLAFYGVPGVAQSTGFFGDAPPLTINGANALYTQYTVDGLDNNEGFLGGPRVEFPLAGIARFSVLATTYGAELGRSSNGVVNVESRAGSNRWGGEVFGYSRPGGALDATPFRVTREALEQADFHRTQVGGALGGPLRRDRTFAFGTVEYSDEREARIASTALTPFTGSEIRETWKGFARLDHGWSPSQTTTLRFAASDVARAGQGGGVILPEADVTTRRRGTITSLTHRSALRNGEASNTLSAQLGTFRWYFPPTRSDLQTPQVTVVGPDLTTVQAVVGSSNFVFDESEAQLQLRNVFEARFGDAHTLRVGADAVRSRFRLAGGQSNPLGSYTVVNEGNIRASGGLLSIRDIPADVRVLRYAIDANPQQVDLAQTLLGAFVEDRWRVSPSLTLNLGVRWDYDDITSRGESDADLDNFQPRASFSWYATPRSTVRGGAGIYTGKFPYAVYSDAVQFGPEGNASVVFESTPAAPIRFREGPTPAQIQVDPRSFPPREIRTLFSRGLEQPESYQATLGVQRQLGERWGASVDGVWMRTRHLPRSWDLNALERPLTAADSVDRPATFGDPFRPTPPAAGSFRRLTTTDAGGNAEYLGLYTNVRHTPTRALALEGTWVWSRARTDTEDINFNATRGNDFAAEWADAINDRRHKVSLRALYTVAGALRLGALADYQTGQPINRVAFFRDLDGSGSIFGNGFVGNHDRFAGVPRNGERLPDEFLLNLSATGLVPVLGRRVELRADVFNVLNDVIFTGFANGIPGGGPRTQVGRPGDPIVYTAAAPPRQLQFSARYLF
jgi:hypothetical protein